jgi:hypothetical protein
MPARPQAGIDMDALLKDILRLARKYEVAIDSCFASLLIAVCVLVGFATSLDPQASDLLPRGARGEGGCFGGRGDTAPTRGYGCCLSEP